MRTGRIARLLLAQAILIFVSCSRDRPPPATDPIELALPRFAPGQTIRTTVRTTARGGRVSASVPAIQSGATVSLERIRIVEQTTAEESAGASDAFTLVVVDDSLRTTISSGDDDRTDTVKSPLIGRPIVASRDGDGRWRLRLTTGESGPAEEEELIPLEGFENRRWLPDRPVRPGDSWSYDPTYFRNLIERDLGAAAADGVMTLRSVDVSADGERVARIDVAVTAKGAEPSEEGGGTAAAIEAAGSLVIDLETMLERKLSIEGVFRSGAVDPQSETPVEVPVRIELTREVVP